MPPAETTTVDIDRAITFRTMLDEAVPASARRLTWLRDGLATEARLIVDVDLATFVRVMEAAAFHLYVEAHGPVPAFVAERRIELELRLHPALAASLQGRNDAPDEIARSLLGDHELGGANPYLMTESWLCRNVVQAAVLTVEMATTGTVKSGFATIWGRTTAVWADGLAGVVEAVLAERNLPYERLEPTIFRVAAKSANGEWVCLIRVSDDLHQCLVYSIVPELVADDKQAQVAIGLGSVNYDLPIGAFEMDSDDGEVRLRTSIDVSNDRLSAALFTTLLTTNLEVMDEHLVALRDLIAN